jgi:hypothetical protein
VTLVQDSLRRRKDSFKAAKERMLHVYYLFNNDVDVYHTRLLLVRCF